MLTGGNNNIRQPIPATAAGTNQVLAKQNTEVARVQQQQNIFQTVAHQLNLPEFQTSFKPAALVAEVKKQDKPLGDTSRSEYPRTKKSSTVDPALLELVSLDSPGFQPPDPNQDISSNPFAVSFDARYGFYDQVRESAC